MVTQSSNARQLQEKSSPQGRPPLESGDRLSRAEFHRRYSLYPEIKKAELVEGVVIVGFPRLRPPQRISCRLSVPSLGFTAPIHLDCAWQTISR